MRGGRTDVQCPMSLSAEAHVASELGASFSEQPLDLADRAHWGSFLFLCGKPGGVEATVTPQHVFLCSYLQGGRSSSGVPELQGPGGL